jgi:hypothetical protein
MLDQFTTKRVLEVAHAHFPLEELVPRKYGQFAVAIVLRIEKHRVGGGHEQHEDPALVW